ncbi:c-Jun-amino-terminal kinase-interacting protein 4 [Cricetulus griseus]|uniref:Protein transport protein Sec61 subunit gamma n=1 Tax=Cricetulus griseus TaxID=10029 RepID=A0A061I3M5_CRIGR|nr:c-Jun-amino-terminal kinase-interacting protein 4 [Cricetulus griseus]
MDQVMQFVEPSRQFVKDSIRLVKRCTKPDRKEFQKIAMTTAIGFAIMGFIGFFVKLIHIPINNIIVDKLYTLNRKCFQQQGIVIQKFIEFEDSQEQEKKDLQTRVESLESQTRQLELKAKNYADQISRLEEREAELKKEYNALHQRHTEMIHNYMEHLERTKLHQLSGSDQLEATAHSRIRKERPISLGIFPLPAGDGLLTPETQKGGETPGSEQWKFQELSQPHSHTSLKVSNSPEPLKAVEQEDELSDISQGGSKATTPASTANSDVSAIPPDTPSKEDNEGLVKGTDTPNKPEISKHIEVQVGQETRNVSTDSVENEEKSEVQAIIESTPELDMDKDLSGYKGSSTPTKGIENKAFDRNTESLFEELSSAGSGLIGDVDEGADLLGMGREVENLILENTQLLETKNALNVVKNDLIAKVDELTCEKDVLQGELEAVKQAKLKLEEKNKELEEELKKARAEAEDARQKAKDDDDSDIPTAQRKRFTRVEMARVLMERNQYKERLMELQEAVRWTEMIRASRENPAMQEKKRSSIWQFFSRLFSSSSNTTKKPEPPVNLKYNAPTSHVTPSVKKRSSTLSQLPGDKSKAFDFLSEETEASLASRREQKREQYRQVKAHVQKEDGRVQAFGWSLPQKYKQVANGQGENKMKNLPVPVYLRPLDEKDSSMKLWCAVGVNLSGGKTRDGGSVVGASVFYKDVAGLDTEGSKQRSASQSSLDKLDQELKEQQKELKNQEELSSQVWICTSTHAATKVIIIDAIQPGNILDSFTVCNSHVLCIASVPGARETDYPAGEELSESGQVDKASLCGSMTSNSSAEMDSLLGGITVVGCSTEGVTGTATSPSTNGASPVIEKPPEMEAENSEVDENVPTAEEATEATEGNAGSSEDTVDISQPGVYTEHVFTDPLGVQIPEDLSPVFQSSNESDVYKDQISVLPNEQDLVREEAQKMSSLLPTMWLGAQNGCLYVHSSVAQWRKCLHSIKLKDSILSIVHVKGIVLVALADGTLAIFHRGVDGQWDLSNYHLLDLGRPHHSIRCMTVVHDKVWATQRNLDVDIEPYVSKMLGTGKLGFSFVRITALMVSCNRLWVGTGNGVIISIPLTETVILHQGRLLGLRANKTSGAPGNRPGSVIRVYGDENSDKVTPGTFIPYCSMAHAQLCFHGHRDAVKFFVAVPGQVISPQSGSGGADLTADKAGSSTQEPSTQTPLKSMLVISGGEGYIDFRMGARVKLEGENELDSRPLTFTKEWACSPSITHTYNNDKENKY